MLSYFTYPAIHHVRRRNDIGTGFSQNVSLNVAQLGSLDTDGLGTINVSVVQSDLAGNPQSDTAKTLTFTLDRVAPATTILNLSGTDPISLSEAATLVTVSGENNSTLTVLFQGQNGNVTSTLTGTGASQSVSLNTAQITALGDGLVVVSASQVDQAGNPQTATVTSSNFTLEALPPAAPLLALGYGVTDAVSKAEATRAAGVATVRGEANATITVQLLGQTGATITQTIAGDGTAQGLDGQRLGEARHTLQEQVTRRQERDEHALDDDVLADDSLEVVPELAGLQYGLESIKDNRLFSNDSVACH